MGGATSKGNEAKSKMKQPSDISTPNIYIYIYIYIYLRHTGDYGEGVKIMKAK